MYNYKTVFYTLGTLQIILGVFMLIPVIIQLIYNELDSGFVSASIITIIFGVLFFLTNLDHNKNIDLPQAFILTALSWISIAIFGSLPFIFSKVYDNSMELFVSDSGKVGDLKFSTYSTFELVSVLVLSSNFLR